ncbi:MAG: hypothetical protein GX621_18575 [Pirellulaceae bacterium]|nr:hypothetical protein [Pirellulaceae bacterium]
MRTLVSLLLAGLFVLAVAGCAPKDKPAPDAGKDAPAATAPAAEEKPAEPAQ